MRRVFLLLIAAAVSAAGCAHQYPTTALVPIRHVIVMDLNDPTDFREFGADCFQLATIPGVVNVVTGPSLVTNQPDSMHDCNAAVVLDLTIADAGAKLPEHAAYKALLDKWRPGSGSIRTVTFEPHCEGEPTAGDQSPSR